VEAIDDDVAAYRCPQVPPQSDEAQPGTAASWNLRVWSPPYPSGRWASTRQRSFEIVVAGMFQSTSATFSAYASTSVWGFFKLSPARALLRAPEAQRWHRASAVQRCKRKDDAKRLHLLVRICPRINHMKLDKHTHTQNSWPWAHIVPFFFSLFLNLRYKLRQTHRVYMHEQRKTVQPTRVVTFLN
jgi:hypothetical protein